MSESDPGLAPELKRLVEPVPRSRAALAVGVEEHGQTRRHADGDGPSDQRRHVAKELAKLGFSRQRNRKADEGSRHPDRNAQFEHINAKVIAAQAAGQPVISVDTKKKELVGNFKNAGSDYRPKSNPRRVNVHDFEDKELGRVVPYGVYDVTANAGFEASAQRATRPNSRPRQSAAGAIARGAGAIQKQAS